MTTMPPPARTRRTPAALLVLLPVLAGAGPQPAAAQASSEPVAAVVLRTNGELQVARQGRVLPAAAGARLLAGDTLRLADGEEAIVLLSTGDARHFRGPAKQVIPPPPGAMPSFFARTVATLAAVANVDRRALLTREGMIRPIPGVPVQLAPRGGRLVWAAAPTLFWSHVDAADGYMLQLRQVGGRPERFHVPADTTWQPPTELVPGTIYEWTVAPLPRGRAAPPQRFRTATLEERGATEAELTAITPQGFAPADMDLLRALVFHEHGFLDAADCLLERVERAGRVTPEHYLLRAAIAAELGLEAAVIRHLEAADRIGGR
jgi:hypothetical protein